MLDVLVSAADPEAALSCFARLAERDPAAWVHLQHDDLLLRRAGLVFGVSEGLGDFVAAHPARLDTLRGDLEPEDVDAVRDRCLRALPDSEDPAEALAAEQRAGLLRIAARDLLGMVDTLDAAAELSALAAGVMDAAVGHAQQTASGDARLAVIGMGKLGGRELNYVSDVDVLFVYEGDLLAARRAAERFLRLLGHMTPLGRTYEIDTNLRPEGRDGPLVRTLDSYRSYYDRWAKTWEYQALLKARPVAGDERLGRDFTALVERYVWPDRLEGIAIGEIQKMKAVVEQSTAVRKAGTRHVKLGPGGLRDIEFAVQLLQLVHGRHDRRLRSGNTLEALSALADGGYVDDGDANLFGDAYQFLRTVEHRLQLRPLRRVHVVPGDETSRYRLARACGFRDIRAASALAQFDREYRRVQSYTRRLHEKLFYRPLLERFAELSADAHRLFPEAEAGSVGLDTHAARERLTALGFADPDAALRHLAALATGTTRRARLMHTVLPALLPTLAAAPDPDSGLAGFRSLTERLEKSPTFLRTLQDSPPVGQMLAQVLGRSRRVGEWLERQPEVFAHLADPAGLDQRLEPEAYRRLADGLARRGGTVAEIADAVRRLKRREVTRIAFRDLTGRASVTDVAAELTGLAEACLETAVGLSGGDGAFRIAVIGMGKLGGREIGYASDLDVLVVFEPAAARAEALAGIEQLIDLLSGITPEGQVFHVDLGLRPEGKDGPLARTLESYAGYYERWAQPWEIQALTQARPVAGDPELGERFCDLIHPVVYPETAPLERLRAVRTMKARVERERTAGARRGLGARRGDRIDLKMGPGGLADVEWTVQLLQLQMGGRKPALRGAGTLRALASAADSGVLPSHEAQWLADGWSFLARVRNALYLGGARHSHLLPGGPGALDRLAQRLGYPAPGGQALMEELTRVMRRVRKVHERRFYEA